MKPDALAKHLIDSNRYKVLGTVDPDGRPRVSPVYSPGPASIPTSRTGTGVVRPSPAPAISIDRLSPTFSPRRFAAANPTTASSGVFGSKARPSRMRRRSMVVPRRPSGETSASSSG